MKAIGSVNLYSGMPDPEMELSDDDAQLLITKSDQLTQGTYQFHSKLGFSGYFVRFQDNGDGILALHVHDNVVTIWREVGKSPDLYVDTAGIGSALASMLSSLYP